MPGSFCLGTVKVIRKLLPGSTLGSLPFKFHVHGFHVLAVRATAMPQEMGDL